MSTTTDALAEALRETQAWLSASHLSTEHRLDKAAAVIEAALAQHDAAAMRACPDCKPIIVGGEEWATSPCAKHAAKKEPASGAQSEDSETRTLLMKTTGCLGLLISKYKPNGPAYAETYTAAKAHLHRTFDEGDAARAAQGEKGGL